LPPPSRLILSQYNKRNLLCPLHFLRLSVHAGLSLISSAPIPAIPEIAPPTPQAVRPASLLTAPLAEDLQSSDEENSDSDVESPSARSPGEREAERIRVLEAAGFMIRRNDVDKPAGSPIGNRRSTRRRAAPMRPDRPSSAAHPEVASHVVETTEPEEADAAEDHEERMEDAYDLYQRVMRELPDLPDSVSHEISPPSSPTPSASPSLYQTNRQSTHSLAPSTSSTGAASNFLTRVVTGMRTPSAVSERRVSSWASLIDQSALENVPDRERKRQESIFEFISTEQSYVQSLQLIIEVFFGALQPMLTQKASEIVFANIEDILMFNTVFLSELEDRQRVARLYIDTIGDVVKSHIAGLDVYRVYCVNQSNAARTLVELKSSDPALRGKLDTLRVKNLELEHFLLEPMQRLTRYPLLISQILRYTEPDHPDQNTLQSALASAESMLSVVNEAVRWREDEAKLAFLTDNLIFAGVDARLELTAPTKLLGRRRILKEGELTKAKSGRKLNTYLFNDLLLFTETKAVAVSIEVVYRWPIPLDECSVKDHKR
ncbi:hypothetical protein P7C70_g5926, partial [Phenoliferia sp. Uapishka_3]